MVSFQPTHQTLRKLSEFAHVVVRIGVSGAIHFSRDGRTGELCFVLYYDPVGSKDDAFFREPAQNGRVIGNNSVLAAAIVKALTSKSFVEFSRDPSISSDEERYKFALAKGPDFVSRRSSHIDTIGINPRSENDSSFVIRAMYFCALPLALMTALSAYVGVRLLMRESLAGVALLLIAAGFVAAATVLIRVGRRLGGCTR